VKKKTVQIAFLLLLSVIPIILFACAKTKSMVTLHPIELTAPPLCSDCHADDKTAMDHTTNYITRHKFYLAQNKQSCNVCHKEAFCSNCHAHKDELKPSDKYKSSPEMTLPHRGDYLVQHRIDGRLNPASCFRCHGRQNNERCATCHR
jgi:hypothetical protein